MATTWLDMSALYGSTPDVVHALRSHKGGKLLTQEAQARGTSGKSSYLPYNHMNVSTCTRPGVDTLDLFAGGDPRTNEDWVMLGIHIVPARPQPHLRSPRQATPRVRRRAALQTVRMVMRAKHMAIVNSYQMAYWTDEMPRPTTTGSRCTARCGKLMTVSVEMAVIYRFHESIIPSFPIKDGNNETLWEQDLFTTDLNASGFGLRRRRGMLATHIPNFKSGVDENFRSAAKYRGQPFDLMTWSIVHEREQGLSTFNQYFRAYNEQDPAIEVPIRNTFKKFSSDPQTIADLKRLYKHPDEVDLVLAVR
ncbi:hypothetical protein PG987_004968 [Apiospora arundinis]